MSASRAFATLLTALAVAGCAGPPAAPSGGLRDAATPIWSAATLAQGRLVGQWYQTADAAPVLAPECLPGQIRFSDAPGGGLMAEGHLCLAGRAVAIAGPVTALGLGRFGLPGIAEPVWVLWVDEGYRSLALGTPSGRFGLLLDRSRSMPADRARAAQEILAWNGYRIATLR